MSMPLEAAITAGTGAAFGGMRARPRPAHQMTLGRAPRGDTEVIRWVRC